MSEQNNTESTITINKKDMYVSGGDSFFEYKFIQKDGHVAIWRDVYVDINRWLRPQLDRFAMELKIPKYRKLKKPELLAIIKARIVFEK